MIVRETVRRRRFDVGGINLDRQAILKTAHNFSVDESRGILYAAYYNGGVRAIDIRGDLSSCDAANQSPDGRCDLARMGREISHWMGDGYSVYVWGVQLSGGRVYASDMLNGIWKLSEASFPP